MKPLQYGSFEVQSTSMKNILANINQNTDKKFFVVVGEPGSGKTTTINYIHQTVFGNQPVTFIEDGSNLPEGAEAALVACSKEMAFDYLKQIDISRALVIELPQLAGRKNDLLPFAQFFIQVLSLMNNKKSLKLTEKAAEKLLQYDWPGQFYELESVLEESYHLAHQDESKMSIEPEHIQLNLPTKGSEFSIGQKLDEVERKYILQTLYFVHQNRTKAAEILGISIRTLRNKINQYRQEGFL